MFGAMFRWVRSLGYLMTGRIDDSRRGLDSNPYVVKAKYDDIIREKTSHIHQYKQAVASLIAQQEKKMVSLTELTAEIEKLERLKAGALAKAKQSTSALQAQGKSIDEIKSNEDYVKCLAAYNDFSSTLGEKQGRVTELEADVADYGNRINEHKTQLQALLRDIDKVRAESADAVTDIITAKEEKEIADTLSGIAKDGTSAELQRLRELRREVKAEARVSKALSGSDTRAQEAEFLEYARRSEDSNEFDALIGLARGAEKSPESGDLRAEGDSRLPE